MAEPQQTVSELIPEQSIPKSAEDSTLPDRPVSAFNEKPGNERLIDQEIEDRKADRILREKYAEKAFQLAGCILFFWVMIIIAVGLCFGCTDSKIQLLSDKVLIAITAGATANVFAAFLGVIRGLFPGNRKRLDS
jgi:hypothetical protein